MWHQESCCSSPVTSFPLSSLPGFHHTQALMQVNSYSWMDCCDGRNPVLFILNSLFHSLVHGTKTILHECHCEIQGKGRLTTSLCLLAQKLANWLLVGMSIDTATMENSMEVPQKTKSRTTIRPSNPTTGHIPWENHNSKSHVPQCSLQLYL